MLFKTVLCSLNSIARIAPENYSEIESFRTMHDPCLIFVDENNFQFRVNTESNEITIPTGALEFLWSACYSFHVIYNEYYTQNMLGAYEFDLNGNNNSREALQLYHWGKEQLNSESFSVWPENLPKPAAGRENANISCKIADELYLCAIAWILHHEIAHIQCDHPNEALNDEESRREEKEADAHATSWILNGVSDINVLEKRGLGVAIATLVLTSQDILLGEFKETTHPKSFQRLYDALNEYFEDGDSIIYVFCTVICHMNMRLAEIEFATNENETWKENFESCLLIFNRLTTA